ncbi:MAG: polysaccharide pyruvyl transferase family protein [Clostridia bacterium]|nr:polysaccharide pyruvyl transferase family protein [Clostridia bacterium]
MRKIGLAIVTYTINYGTFLQAFATQEAVRDLGYSTEIINIDSVISDVSKRRKKYFISQLFNFSELKSYKQTIQAIIKKKTNKKYKTYIKEREKKFKDFHDNYFTFGPLLNGWNELSDSCLNYDSVIVGSDQLWRPANIAGDFYTLNFVPNETNKISYATSFGLKEIRKNQEEKVSKFLSRINFLSSREQNGVNIIKKYTNRDAKLVCDPTILLSKNDWSKYIGDAPIIDGDYVFTYLLSKNPHHREFVKKLASETGCEIVGVLHGAGYVKGDEKNVDFYPAEIGPFEFLNLIKNSKYVCTDSFHGCVFASIFEKDFYAFKRFSDKDKMSTNNRVTNLLHKFGLEDRLIEDFNDVSLNQIDYDEVRKSICNFRDDSLKYLKTALEKSDVND